MITLRSNQKSNKLHKPQSVVTTDEDVSKQHRLLSGYLNKRTLGFIIGHLLLIFFCLYWYDIGSASLVFRFHSASVYDDLLGIEYPQFSFNVTRDIDIIARRQILSNNKEFTNFIAKFGLIRISYHKIEYLTWKPLLTSTITDKGKTKEIEFDINYKEQASDRHARMSISFARDYWKPALLKLQNKLNYYESIIIPLNFFSSAIDVWEPWIQELTKQDSNSVIFSYCMPVEYLHNTSKYHSYLLPRYYTDPPEYFGIRGNGHVGNRKRHFHNSKPQTIGFFEKYKWETRSNKAVFRGSLTNPWRYELFKIFYDSTRFYNVSGFNNIDINKDNDNNNNNNNFKDKEYATKYNLSNYMDISLTNSNMEAEFASSEIFNNFIINTPILHQIMITNELRNEIYTFIKHLSSKLANAMSFEQQIENFKYVIHIDGWTCAARLPKYLTAGFVVIWLRDDINTPNYRLTEDWYFKLIPYKHYIPVQWGDNNYRRKPRLDLNNENDLKTIDKVVKNIPKLFLKKIDELVNVIKYLQDNDNIAKEIAMNAQNFMKNEYTKKFINDRIFQVLDHLPIENKNNDGVDTFLNNINHQNDEIMSEWKLLPFIEKEGRKQHEQSLKNRK